MGQDTAGTGSSGRGIRVMRSAVALIAPAATRPARAAHLVEQPLGGDQ